MEGVTPTQLRWYGEVVLDVLAKAQRSVSPHVRQTLDPLIVQCVRVIEHPPGMSVAGCRCGLAICIAWYDKE